MAKISPEIGELDHSPTGLNLGEWYVLDALRALDDGWLVFVRPQLDGGRPAFVVAHPSYGICVIDVRDWTVGSHRQDFDGRIEANNGVGWIPTAERPRSQVHRCRSEIVKRFFDEVGSPAAKMSLVKAIVVMPRVRTSEARELLAIPQAGGRGEQSVDVWGGGMLKISPLAVITGRAKPLRRKVPSSGFDRMRRALERPEFAIDASLEYSN